MASGYGLKTHNYSRLAEAQQVWVCLMPEWETSWGSFVCCFEFHDGRKVMHKSSQ